MTDTETDPFSELLAEALRAGPGSIAWKEAVVQIGANPGDNNEHQLLLEARDLLAGGRSFREIRAGAGFTRKLMEGLDKEKDGGKSKPVPTPLIIISVSLLAILIALTWLGYHLFAHGDRGAGASSSDLAAMYFPSEWVTGTFKGTIPPLWRTIGKLPLDSADGLNPAAGNDVAGAAIVLNSPVPPDEPFAFEAELHLKHPSDNVVSQIFISTTGDFSDDRATSLHELLWSLRGRSQQVVLDGRVIPESQSTVHGDTVQVRIVMNRDQAIVESNSHPLWSGPHALGATPRWPGVRFIRSAGDGDAGVTVESVKVLKR